MKKRKRKERGFRTPNVSPAGVLSPITFAVLSFDAVMNIVWSLLYCMSLICPLWTLFSSIGSTAVPLSSEEPLRRSQRATLPDSWPVITDSSRAPHSELSTFVWSAFSWTLKRADSPDRCSPVARSMTLISGWRFIIESVV